MPLSTIARTFGQSCAFVMTSIGVHALGTDSIDGLGEITLRDGLVVAAASVGASLRQAWVIRREHRPADWGARAIDLVVARLVGQNERLVLAAEVKWWRDAGAANAANRRRDLVTDFLRAASIYPEVEDSAFVVLLATEASYQRTLYTNSMPVHEIRQHLISEGSTAWNLRNLKHIAAIRGAVAELRNDIRIPNVFHSELVLATQVRSIGVKNLHAIAWTVRKPQHTVWLDDNAFDEIGAG